MFNWFIGYIAVGIIVIALHPELRLSFVSAITGQKMDLTGVVVAVFATLVTLLIWPVAIFFRTFVNSNRDRIWPQLKSQLAAEGVSFDQEDILLTTLDSVICKKLREADELWDGELDADGLRNGGECFSGGGTSSLSAAHSR